MLGRNRVQAESRQGTEGMQGSDGTGTGHRGTHRAIRTCTGHSGVQAGLMQGAGAPSWQLPPLLQQDGMARLAPSPRDCSVPGLSSGLPPPQGSTLGHAHPDSLGKQGPRRDMWLLPWAEETCD